MIDAIRALYTSMPERLARARREWNRPLTLSEKVLVGHVHDWTAQTWERGKAKLRLRVDRVAMQDATGQMALLQFMQAGKARVAVPIDRALRPPDPGADAAPPRTCARAIAENREVYDFLHSASKKYGIGFWKPGAGIIHQVVLENYAFPGGLMIGADSHTPNGGRARHGWPSASAARTAARSMAGLPWEVLHPKLVGVHLTGKLSGWSVAEGRDHVPLRAPHGQGRHQQDHRVLRPRRRVDQRHRQGHDLQHGRGARRHHVAVPLRRADGRLPRARPTAATSPAGRAVPRASWCADPEVHAEPRGRSTTRWSRSTSPTLEPHIVGPALARPRAADLEARRRGEEGTAGRPRSRPRSSAPAPTRPTRT